MEDQSPFLAATFFGPWLAGAVAEQAALFRPGVVVVDYLLRSAVCEAEAQRIPLILLMHMAYRFHARLAGDPDAPWGWRWQLRVAITEALASLALRGGARRMAGALAACGGASAAADEVEQVARWAALRQPVRLGS